MRQEHSGYLILALICLRQSLLQEEKMTTSNDSNRTALFLEIVVITNNLCKDFYKDNINAP